MCRSSKLEPQLIGFHGQTIFHNPEEKGLHLGNLNYC